eukprot:1750818-Prymnesium_polylepis.1
MAFCSRRSHRAGTGDRLDFGDSWIYAGNPVTPAARRRAPLPRERHAVRERQVVREQQVVQERKDGLPISASTQPSSDDSDQRTGRSGDLPTRGRSRNAAACVRATPLSSLRDKRQALITAWLPRHVPR